MQKDVSLWKFILLALFFSLFLVGCSEKAPKPEESMKATEGLGPAESLDTEASEIAATMEGRTSGPMLPVYFSFDSAAIEGDQVSRIEKNADFIKKNSAIQVRIEGNCDPRGTREYNLALGERRAQSAKKYLVNLGVAGGQLTTISWGEEKLLLYGHDELSWAQNRRADFVIVK